jgi:TolB-like protein/Flp pilus assembly protein TadD
MVAVVAVFAFVRARPPAIRSIAVLPFSGTVAEAEFVGEGMADEIVRDLSRIDGLRVIAPSSTARYRGTVDPRKAARELNVDAALVGNLEVIGERLSLDARLVRAADGMQLWSRRYSSDVSQAATLQREVVTDLGEGVGWKAAPPRAQTRNPEAYAAYQHGRHAVQKQTAPSLKEAIEYFHKAIELDPDYAQAWAALAYAHGRQGIIGVVSTRAGIQQEKAEAEKAVALDPSLPDGHLYLALVASVAGDEAVYQREMARVLELDPNFAEAWLDRANHLLLQKKFAEAETMYQRARSLDPMSPHVMSSYGAHLIVMRQYAAAVTVFFNLTEQFPEYQTGIANLGMTYSYMGRHAEALAQIERVNLAMNPNYALWRGVILARAGRVQEARAIAAQTDDAVKVRFFPPYYRAMLRAELGDRDKALALLEEVKRNGDWQVKFLPYEQAFDSLREDPRFKALLR